MNILKLLIPTSILGFLFFGNSKKSSASTYNKPILVENLTNDYQIISRLKQLGYFWTNEDNLDYTLDLFDSICIGSVVVKPIQNAKTLEWLNSKDTPKWQEIPKYGEGFINTDDDGYNFGTSWLIEVIQEAGKNFEYKGITDIGLNDVSTNEGGPNADHATHQTGLNVDIKLPHINGEIGGITYKDSEYSQEIMRGILKAFRSTGKIKSILFNDPKLINEGLCSYSNGHDNHAHVIIKPKELK